MRYKWFPWRWIVKRLARRHGFLDPLSILAQMQRFAQPSEVGEPVELLRAGMIFHARGLMNVRAIQHNLDWIWPYWVVRQFDPADESFVPRAFSFSHINLTHRNWTAVGLPDCPVLPIVDPRGLVTAFYDSWSVDAWIVTESGRALIPSRQLDARQRLRLGDSLRVNTRSEKDGLQLEQDVELAWEEGPHCRISIAATPGNHGKAWLVIGVRPYNPEGVSFIYSLSSASDRREIRVNKDQTVVLERPPERILFSHYREGDVANRLFDGVEAEACRCDVGMATAAALFPLEPVGETRLTVTIPLGGDEEMKRGAAYPLRSVPGWRETTAPLCRLRVPDKRIQFLFDAAVRTLVLHSPLDVFPGPYTYKRFWFRDAAYLIDGLLACGMTDRAERALDQFAHRQTPTGYFRSQEGEWDSNGEAIWIYHRYCLLTGRKPKAAWLRAVRAGARWIGRKRLRHASDPRHAGLLPAGFSAEHLGPNDYYYWDDFWGVAGLRAAAELLEAEGDASLAAEFRAEADDFMAAIEASIAATRSYANRGSIPASPYRRMDAGAIGSVVVDYPLRLWNAGDSRVMATAEYLHANCFVRGAFFQDMIHSGLNAYLTLHLAQVFLRGGNAAKALELLESVAAIASPTGQWPEAIHPRTDGGCMGDGQHAWAAADWVLAVRHFFVREEEGEIVLGSGVPESWIPTDGSPIDLGPTPTSCGPVTVEVRREGDDRRVSWSATWRKAVAIRVALPGCEPVLVAPETRETVVRKSPAD